MYDVTAHPILSEKAKKLVTDNAPQFAEYERMAERLLGIAGTSYTGDAGDDVLLAVAMQVNFELSSGTAPFIEQSSADKGTKQESVTYRAIPAMVDPRAKSIIDAVLADMAKAGTSSSMYRTLRSARTPCSQ